MDNIVYNDTLTFKDGTVLTWSTRNKLGLTKFTYAELKKLIDGEETVI